MTREERILARLEPAKKDDVRRVLIPLQDHTVDKIKRIVKAMRKASGQRMTQTMFFNDAVEVFIAECLNDPEIQKMLPSAKFEIER